MSPTNRHIPTISIRFDELLLNFPDSIEEITQCLFFFDLLQINSRTINMRHQIFVVFGVKEIHEIVVCDELFGLIIGVALVLFEPPGSLGDILIDKLISNTRGYLHCRSDCQKSIIFRGMHP